MGVPSVERAGDEEAPCGVNQAARTFDLAPGPAVFCARLTCTCEAVVVAVPRVAGSYSRVADAFAHSCRKHRTQCTGHSSSIARHVSTLMSERAARQGMLAILLPFRGEAGPVSPRSCHEFC